MTIDNLVKLNNTIVGDIIETNKYKYYVIEKDICEGCFLMDKDNAYCANFQCDEQETKDKKNHIFVRVKKRIIKSILDAQTDNLKGGKK